MGPGLVSLMFTIGVCTWIYTKLMRTTGNDTGRSLTAIAIAGVLIFIVSFFIFNMFL